MARSRHKTASAVPSSWGGKRTSFVPGSVIALLGRALKTVDHGGVRTEWVNSAAEYVRTLQEKFGLELPLAADLWPKITSRHKALFGN